MLDAVLNDAQIRQAESQDAVALGPIEIELKTIQALCSQDDIDQIIAAIINHNSDDTWFAKASASLKNGSPSSAYLADLLLHRAQHMPLADVFRMEYIAALHCAARPDFAEGIRALLIDKDLQPTWHPATHADITPEWINGFIDSHWSAEAHPLADLA